MAEQEPLDAASADEAPREREFQAQRERERGVAPRGPVAPDEEAVERETSAAAREAARIGGDPGGEIDDEAARASLESGGGEAEGFEQAEAALVEQAEHREGHDPADDAYVVAEDARRDAAAHGDADEIRSTETQEGA